MSVSTAIETRALRKVYDAPSRLPRGGGLGRATPALGSQGMGPVVALVGLDLAIRQGEFFGLLGPNGAGKTTTIGILTTRVRATSGAASVAGADVLRDPVGVRRRIGVVPQRPNPDRGLDVIENLMFHGTYFGLPASESRARGLALLERLGMIEKAKAKVDALSGGQQQRLMIARALLHEPQVVFLDEPTVGLDPQARLAFWDILRGLHAEGRTIVMTTHYMEEADQLCERIAIIDRGVLLACDTPRTLKARAPGGTLIIVSLDGPAEPALVAARSVAGIEKADAVGDDLRVYATRGGEVLPPLIRAAEATGRSVRDIHLVPPSLESLFVSLTGRTLA
jgi:ABC-2 type transport system ATP-binding protein